MEHPSLSFNLTGHVVKLTNEKNHSYSVETKGQPWAYVLLLLLLLLVLVLVLVLLLTTSTSTSTSTTTTTTSTTSTTSTTTTTTTTTTTILCWEGRPCTMMYRLRALHPFGFTRC